MIRHAIRVLPLLATALLMGLLGTGALALAHDGPGEHHSHDGDHGTTEHEHSDHHESSGSQGPQCDQGSYSAWDEQWLTMSIEGDLFEIQGGKIAEHMGATHQVRSLGVTLVHDHTQSLQDATALAEKLGIDVPSEPSPSEQWELQVVQQFHGTAFDRWYSDLEVQDHKQDIQEASDEVSEGCNPDVRSDAKDEIPMLQRHLELAEAALASVS